MIVTNAPWPPGRPWVTHTHMHKVQISVIRYKVREETCRTSVSCTSPNKMRWDADEMAGWMKHLIHGGDVKITWRCWHLRFLFLSSLGLNNPFPRDELSSTACSSTASGGVGGSLAAGSLTIQPSEQGHPQPLLTAPKPVAFFFNRSRVILQCLLSFRCTAKWFHYTYIYFFRFFSLTGYYKILSIFPCAIQ